MTSKEKYKILVVDDETDTRKSLINALHQEGFLCFESENLITAKKVIQKARPDLMVLDINFPDGSGFNLLKSIRENDDLPIILCTGNSNSEDKILGLEFGADDYITKPFSPKELALRVGSVLRRTGTSPQRGKITFGNVSIDIESREVYKNGVIIQLTGKEFDLLVHLARHPRTIFSREDLLKNVWSHGGERTIATVTEHIRRLRSKIEDDPDKPRFLNAVRGIGYRFLP